MSYMDRDNIIEEGLFDKLKDYFKNRKKYDRLTKILMKDPEFKKKYKDAEKSIDDYQKALEDLKKQLGVD